MANVFINLPTAAANGAGAGVDLSGLAASKTVIVSGVWPTTKQPTINIEVNNDPAQAGTWSPIATFQGAGTQVFAVAARWMRARVSGYRGGPAPAVNVGATVSQILFAALAATAGNGAGAAVDISTLGSFKTAQIGGTFKGSVIVEFSTDGATDWGQPFLSTQNGVAQSGEVTANWARVRRSGVPVISPGLPIINLGGGDPPGGGGGGGGTLQAFTYTVTGLEPDPSDFMVTIPIPVLVDTYKVFATPAGSAVLYSYECPDLVAGDRTLTQFRFVASTTLTAGDLIDFLLVVT